MDDFNFTNILSDRVIGCSTEGANYCCFRKAVSNNFIQKFFENVLLMSYIRTYSNLPNYFIFVHRLLIEGYEHDAPRKDLISTPFVEQFYKATLRNSY